jgi:hypothetical protein
MPAITTIQNVLTRQLTIIEHEVDTYKFVFDWIPDQCDHKVKWVQDIDIKLSSNDDLGSNEILRTERNFSYNQCS